MKEINVNTEIEWKAQSEMGLPFYYIKWRKKTKNWLQRLFYRWHYVYSYYPPTRASDDPDDSLLVWFLYSAYPENVVTVLDQFKEYKTYGEYWMGFASEQSKKHAEAVKRYNKYWSEVPSEKNIY